MKKKQHWFLKGRCLLLIFICFSLCMPMVSMASSWTENLDQSIYEEVYTEDQKEEIQRELEGLEDRNKGEVGSILSSLFGKFFITFGDGIYKLIAPMGFDMNTVIYGRVGGSASRTHGISLFTYELTQGNIYGVVSMALYGLLRGMVTVIMICVFLYQMVAFLWSSGSARARDSLKNSVQVFITMFLLMLIFPKILDVMLYVRDVILYTEMRFGSEFVCSVGSSINPDWVDVNNGGNIAFDFFGTGSSYSLIGTFRTIVENDKSSVNAAIYLGTVVLQFYFGIIYVSSAFAMVVMVVLLPFCVVIQMFDRSTLSSWLKEVMGILLNPILDSCLLLIPMMFMIIGYQSENAGYSLMALIACSCILPARGIIRSVLRLGNGMGFELAGLGAVMGAMRLIGSVGRGINNIASRIGNGMESTKQDEELADMYSEQSRRQELESINEQESLQKDIQAMIGTADGSLDIGGVASNSISEAEMAEMAPEQSARARQENLQNGLKALNIRKEQLNNEMREGEIQSSQIGEQMAEIDLHTAQLRAKRAGLDSKDPDQAESICEIDQQIAENGVDRQQLASKQTAIRMNNSSRRDQIGKISAIEGRARTAQQNFRGAGIDGRSGAVGEGEQMILDRYATIDNFDLPEFRNISMERKADLYRQRARRTRAQAVASVGTGATGSVALGALGFAGSTYGSSIVQTYATSLGIDVGGTAGAAIGDFVGTKASNIKVEILGRRHASGPIDADVTVRRYDQPRQVKQLGDGVRHLSLPGVSAYYYSDGDRVGTPYERQPSDYEPNWVRPEIEKQKVREQQQRDEQGMAERRQKYHAVYNGFVSDPSERASLVSEMKRSMREVSVVARQSYNSIRNNEMAPRTEAERQHYNQRIMEEALELYGRSMSDKVIIPDAERYKKNFDMDEFNEFVEERFKVVSRGQVERYLRSKGILF